MNQSYEILEYHKILEQLAQNASSPLVKEKCRTLEPYLSEAELGRQMRETSQARELLDRMGAAPIPVMEKIRELVEKAVRGELLMPEELEELGVFLAAVRRMQDYLRRGMQFGIGASFYAENLCEEEELEQEIARCIRGGKIDDYASATLKRIRKELVLLEEKIKEKAASLLRANKNAMAENFVVNRNGRICLPVKKDLRGKIKGTVVDQSGTGATLFIEPEVIAGIQTDYENLKIEEDTEERIMCANTPVADFCPEEVKTAVQEVEDKMAAGEFTAFTGPIYKQDGTLVYEEGYVATDTELDGCDFFVKGVIGEEN